MSEPRIVKLSHPVEFGKETVVEELSFRRGRAGDMKGIRIGGDIPVDDIIKVAARLCGQPTQVIERLDEEDSGEVFAIALGFIGRSLGTGSAP